MIFLANFQLLLLNLLVRSVGENSNLCASDSCERKKTKKNIVLLTLASVVGFLMLSLTIAAIFCGLTRRKKQDKTRG